MTHPNYLHTQALPPHGAGYLARPGITPAPAQRSENSESMLLPSMHFAQSTMQTTDGQIKYERRSLSRLPVAPGPLIYPEGSFLKTRSFCCFCFALLFFVLCFVGYYRIFFEDLTLQQDQGVSSENNFHPCSQGVYKQRGRDPNKEALLLVTEAYPPVKDDKIFK